MNFVMNHAPGAGSITRPVDQQSNPIPLYHRCPPFTLSISVLSYETVWTSYAIIISKLRLNSNRAYIQSEFKLDICIGCSLLQFLILLAWTSSNIIISKLKLNRSWVFLLTQGSLYFQLTGLNNRTIFPADLDKATTQNDSIPSTTWMKCYPHARRSSSAVFGGLDVNTAWIIHMLIYWPFEGYWRKKDVYHSPLYTHTIYDQTHQHSSLVLVHVTAYKEWEEIH